MHDYRKRFEERTFREGNVVGNLVTPFRGMALITLDGSVVRVYTGELNVFAKVVPTVQAEETFATWNAGLDGYAIAWNKVSNQSFKPITGLLPGCRLVTPSPHCRTIPAASCPNMQSPSTTNDPILPCLQKWMSELEQCQPMYLGHHGRPGLYRHTHRHQLP